MPKPIQGVTKPDEQVASVPSSTTTTASTPPSLPTTGGLLEAVPSMHQKLTQMMIQSEELLEQVKKEYDSISLAQAHIMVHQVREIEGWMYSLRMYLVGQPKEELF